jgi:hypothetical protein
MKEEAHPQVLDRTGPRDAVRAQLKHGIELLREVTNYGTGLTAEAYAILLSPGLCRVCTFSRSGPPRTS